MGSAPQADCGRPGKMLKTDNRAKSVGMIRVVF
jgi:hypothetical protein